MASGTKSNHFRDLETVKRELEEARGLVKKLVEELEYLAEIQQARDSLEEAKSRLREVTTAVWLGFEKELKVQMYPLSTEFACKISELICVEVNESGDFIFAIGLFKQVLPVDAGELTVGDKYIRVFASTDQSAVKRWVKTRKRKNKKVAH